MSDLNRFGIMGIFAGNQWGEVYRRVIADVYEMSVEAQSSMVISVTVVGATTRPDDDPEMRALAEQVRQLHFLMYSRNDTEGEEMFTQEERDLLKYFDEAERMVRLGEKRRRKAPRRTTSK